MIWFKHRKSVSFVGGVVGMLTITLAIFLAPLNQTQAQSSLESFQKDLDFMRSNAEAVLLFNPFGTNPDPNFVKHYLTEDQISYLCRNAPCERMGINTASHFTELRRDRPYSKADRLGMDYMLEIVDTISVAAAGKRIREEKNQFDIIVRFGTGEGSGLGDDDSPASMISMLQNLNRIVNPDPNVAQVEFYAIAGPNEPDIETWYQVYDKSCGAFQAGGSEEQKQAWYACAGSQLAQYMNEVCAAQASGNLPNNIKLLSPAFNLTSGSFGPLYESWLAAGANTSCLEGVAGNIYPNGGTVQDIWDAQWVDRIELPIFITETGPWGGVSSNDSDGSWYNPTADQEITGAIYVNPILGIFPPASRDVGEIRDSLINQGYQAYCATPTYIIEPKVTGAIELFLDNVEAGLVSATTLNVGSTQIIDYTEAQTPMFRDTDRKRELKSDLEEYFGFKQVQETDNYGQTEVQSAAVNSLLSDVQKCVQTADNLEIQEIMCNKLVMSDQCALYASQIPGTDYTVKSLLGAYKAYAGIRTNKLEVCKEIAVGEGGEELRTGMVNATNYFERASRIAFLVLAINQKAVEENKLFNFFSHSDKADPRHEVLVVAFRVPDIGTNKGSTWESETVTNASGEELYTQVKRDANGRKVEKVESGHTFWNDPMTLVRNVLIPRKTAENLDLKGTKYREELREAGASATMQNANSLIYCLQNQAPYGTGSETCNNEAVKAVVDIVNATWVYDKERVTCDNLTIDQVDEIGETAVLGEAGYTTFFQPKYGEYILNNITRVDGAEQNFTSKLEFNVVNGKRTWPPDNCVPLDQGQGAEGDCTTMNYYLVYPMGYDAETLEYVMARTFLTTEQFDQYADNPLIKERFNIFGDQVELDSETEVHEYTDELGCHYENGYRVCPEEEFEATLVSNQGPALFFGGRLGFWVREIQKVFNRADSLSYAYLTKCRSTEEFLLDQCGGKPGSTTYDETNYCSNEKSGKIVRDVTNEELSRFQFYDENGLKIDDADNEFFPTGNELGCSLDMSARAVDGLTLILSGGKDILPNNPGNVLGCVGNVSVASRVKIYQLPANTSPPPLDPTDARWENAPYMRTSGGSAAQIEYNLTLKPAYYLVTINVTGDSICLSNFTRVMDNTDPANLYRQIDTDGYVIDFTDTEQCADGACMDASLQYAMEGGGKVYETDDEGNKKLVLDVHWASDFVEDNLGCQLSFKDDGDYDILLWNNTCGGGRKHGCADPEGTLGGDCDYWNNFIGNLNSGSVKELWRKGYEAFKSVYGRKLTKTGNNFNCTAARSGLDDPIFSNTISVYNCENYAGSLDSLHLFGKVVGFQIAWWDGANLNIQMPLPPTELWNQITAAEQKYGCDKWLMLAIASSEGPLGTYLNDNQPNDYDAQGYFSLTGDIWNVWKAADGDDIDQCYVRQPSAFNPSDFNSYLDVHDVGAQVDQACRIALYTGIQKYPDDQEAFRQAFYAISNPKENSYGVGWSDDQTAQANYVWEFWKKARESAEEPAVAQPANWPPQLCDGAAQAPEVIPDNPDGVKKDDPEYWKQFLNYSGSTSLPAEGIATFYYPEEIDPIINMNAVLNNRTNVWGQINSSLLNNCELKTDDVADINDRLAKQQQLASTNGSTKVVGCAAMLRLGDVPFLSSGDPNQLRQVWVTTNSGPFANQALGPLAVIDVAGENDLQGIYEGKGGKWIIDLDYYTFELLYDHNSAWKGPQEIKVCDTKEQCQ